MADNPGPASSVLAIVDGSDEHREAATVGAELLAASPGLQVTVLASSDVAQPSGAPPSSNGTNGSGLLLQRKQDTGQLMKTVREIEDKGLPTKLRTIDEPLVENATRIAQAHDLVILPASLADRAEAFPVPTLVAP